MELNPPYALPACLKWTPLLPWARKEEDHKEKEKERGGGGGGDAAVSPLNGRELSPPGREASTQSAQSAMDVPMEPLLHLAPRDRRPSPSSQAIHSAWQSRVLAGHRVAARSVERGWCLQSVLKREQGKFIKKLILLLCLLVGKNTVIFLGKFSVNIVGLFFTSLAKKPLKLTRRNGNVLLKFTALFLFKAASLL